MSFTRIRHCNPVLYHSLGHGKGHIIARWIQATSHYISLIFLILFHRPCTPLASVRLPFSFTGQTVAHCQIAQAQCMPVHLIMLSSCHVNNTWQTTGTVTLKTKKCCGSSRSILFLNSKLFQLWKTLCVHHWKRWSGTHTVMLILYRTCGKIPRFHYPSTPCEFSLTF